MAERITCPRCRGRVDIPDDLRQNVTCPFCKAFLLALDPRTGATWRCRPARRWMRPTGIALIVVGLLAGFASLWIEDRRYGSTGDDAIVAALTNPLFFAGVPLGAWLAIRRR